MLTEVKNQLKITSLSIKYAIMREMLNKGTFIMKVIFMLLNDASFIVQWIILYSIKSDIGGYTFEQILLLWGFAAGTFGITRFLFKNAFSLSDHITNGKLDCYLVQPKNVLLSIITGESDTEALGDIIYAYILLFISGVTLGKLLLFTVLLIAGSIITINFAIILGSLSFWFGRSDYIADTGNGLITNFATYPDGIFSGIPKALMYSLVPIGFIIYIPVKLISEFNLLYTIVILTVTIITTILAFIIFYKGLKKYSSSNLMMSKI
ncbi:MAG: ABC-2 family transporter protein [Clostridia bacterium]|nr:ABC-2 family transporter protein [Clostridia bacterium]